MKRKIGYLILIIVVVGLVVCIGLSRNKEDKGMKMRQIVATDDEIGSKDEEHTQDDNSEGMEEESSDLKDAFKELMLGVSNAIYEEVGVNKNEDGEPIELPELVAVDTQDIKLQKDYGSYQIQSADNADVSEYSLSLIKELEEEGTCDSANIICIGYTEDDKRILKASSLRGRDSLIAVSAKQDTTLRGKLTTATNDEEINIFLTYKHTYISIPLNCEFEIDVPEGEVQLIVICNEKGFEITAELEPDDSYLVLD